MSARKHSKVAIVTGASRGVGRGIAIGLGEAGWIVYVTGRTLHDGDSDRPGSIVRTAGEVTAAGGLGIAVRCDHSVDAETERVIQQVWDERDGFDLLVNNATTYTTDIGPPDTAPFWELPVEIWDLMHRVGLRSHYVASIFASRLMVPRRRGLIVNVSSAGAVRYFFGNVSYHVVKAGVDMLTLGTAEELRAHNVAVVSLWPRLTRTEGVLAHPDVFSDPSRSWSPEFSGRAVAALASDPQIMEKSGRAFDIGALAAEYGITDSDGRQPAPLKP